MIFFKYNLNTLFSLYIPQWGNYSFGRAFFPMFLNSFSTPILKVSNMLHHRAIYQEHLKIHSVLLYVFQKNESCTISVWPLKHYALTDSILLTYQTMLEVREEKPWSKSLMMYLYCKGNQSRIRIAWFCSQTWGEY